MVAGLLRDFVQEDWLALIDFSTLEKRGGSYVTDDLRDRDLLGAIADLDHGPHGE